MATPHKLRVKRLCRMIRVWSMIWDKLRTNVIIGPYHLQILIWLELLQKLLICIPSTPHPTSF
jgi:hypothetical protein